MLLKKFKIPIILILFTAAFVNYCFSQENKTVLTPENANEARLNRLQPPDQVMDAIGIKPGMVVAEIGAGQGRYVVQIAARVGETGKVYAEDIDAGGAFRKPKLNGSFFENSIRFQCIEKGETHSFG